MAALKNAIRAVRSLADASSRYGVDYSELLGRYYELYRHGRFSPKEIEFYDLLNPAISKEMSKHLLSKAKMLDFDEMHLLPGYLCVTTDKAVFYSICSAARIPIPRLLGVFDQPGGWTADGRVLQSRAEWCAFLQTLPTDFVVKPALGLLGKGVNSFRREAGSFVDFHGVRRDEQELYDHLLGKGDLNLFTTSFAHHSLKLPHGSRKTILQERLYAHPDIADLTQSRTLCTCRLFTFSDPEGRFHLLASAFRLAGGEALIDNFDLGAGGNLWCGVDPETGRIQDAICRPPGADRLQRTTVHPKTGRTVVGVRIPHWQDVLELARHSASVFRPQSVITWDIGITGEGPVVVEGNIGGMMLPTPLTRPAQSLFT